MSLARFVLYTHDDLSLAETLKSPLFNFDDDQDLFALAYGREKNRSLWSVLHKRASERKKWRLAVERISVLRDVGLRNGPFAFFSEILETGDPSGRMLFSRRIGSYSRDALNELLRLSLEFERTNPRSLSAFIAWFGSHAGEIKREMERVNDAVRVMTVHGAKGLEAGVVFLLDAHRGPNLQKLGPLYELPDDYVYGAERKGVFALAAASAGVRSLETIRKSAIQKAYE